MTSKKFLLCLLMFAYSADTLAERIECVKLKSGTLNKMQLNRADAFNNCFSLAALDPNSYAQVVVYSNDSVKNKVTLYDLDKSAGSNYVSEHHSSNNANNTFVVNTSNRNLGLRITPTSHTNSEKNLAVTFAIVDGLGTVIFDLDDIPSTAPPPRTGGCEIINGTRVCTHER